MISWYVVVKVNIDETKADPIDVINEMDYNMSHSHIHGSEVVDVIMEDYM